MFGRTGRSGAGAGRGAGAAGACTGRLKNSLVVIRLVQLLFTFWKFRVSSLEFDATFLHNVDFTCTFCCTVGVILILSYIG